MRALTRLSCVSCLAVILGCSGGDGTSGEPTTPGEETGTGAETAATDPDASTTPDTNVGEVAVEDTSTPAPDGATVDAPSSDGETGLPPIVVDPKDPKRYDFTFKANEADPTANESLGTQAGYVDTRVKSKGILVVYLHGASDSAPTSCTNGEMANLVTAYGYHLFTPCYNSYYGVGICKDDIGGCRLEAFEGVDHTKVIDIKPANAIEPRIVAGLELLQKKHPGGAWNYFLDGKKPRWSQIIISGISHGASSAGLIGMVRNANRVVMLSGPLDTKQAWLTKTPLTPIDRFFGFTHTADDQHAGHLEAFATMKLPGVPTTVDGAKVPYGDSHRLRTSAATSNGHGSTQPGGSSPKAGGAYVFAPVWKYMFGG